MRHLLLAPLPKLSAAPERFRELAERGDVLFHGSQRGDLEVLEPIRLSNDTTAFGDQQAVYATSDPVWAIFFAILRRDGGYSTRNASLGRAAGPLYPRRYFFSVRRDEPGLFTPGYLYTLPRETFTVQQPFLGAIDSAQWVSHEAVPVLERFEVTPADFPFANRVSTHRENESIAVTILRQVSRRPAIRRRASQNPKSPSTTR